jgi:hypothetical protein
VHTRQERSSAEDVKTVLTVWVRGKTYKTVDEGSRRIEEVKAENDAGIVPPFSGTLVASNEKNHFHKTIKVRHDKVFLLDVKYLAEESITCFRQYKHFSRTFAGTVLPLQVLPD